MLSWEIITALGGPVVPVFKKERKREREREMRMEIRKKKMRMGNDRRVP